MTLSVRPTPYIIPAYSLTGDLLAYLRCGLQYRYQHRGTLPPSKPVQRWFGEFLHGVMEESFRQWAVAPLPFPVSDSYLLDIEKLVIQRLGARGIWPRNRAICDLKARRTGTPVDDLAHRRARASVNIWGPNLFPLIAQAEVRLKGIREMPSLASVARADYYEVQGIVDVLTSVELSTADLQNRLLLELRADPMIARALGQVIAQQKNANRSKCEIIVDYKGMRRPSNTGDPTSEHIYWQILTYTWLREQQLDASPVIGGVLLFLNELEPSRDDMEELCNELFGPGAPCTDVIPFGTDLTDLRT
ncbi:MAG: PD-(D/E)XK nuclease family protein [Ktedonobacteraceae bacterium]